MKRLSLALLLLTLVVPAHAQQNAQVIGPITPGDCAAFSSTTILKDAGFLCNGGQALVIGTTPITGGTNGAVLFDNAGVLGNETPTALFDAICSTNNDFPIRLTGTWQCGATGTSGHAVPFLDGTNTWSSPQTINVIYGSSTAGGTLNLFGTSNGSPVNDVVNVLANSMFFYPDKVNGAGGPNNNYAAWGPGTGPNGEGIAYSTLYHNKDNTGPVNGSELGFWQQYAWDGTQQAPTAIPLAIVWGASETWTATHHGAVVFFQTIPNGTANAVNEFSVGNGVSALASGDNGETQGVGQGTFNARNAAGYYIQGTQIASLSGSTPNFPAPTLITPTTQGNVNSTGTAPTCTATGIGSTGTCGFNTGANDYAGLIELTVGGSGIAASGSITLTLNASLGANAAACILQSASGSATWTAPVTITNTTVSKTAPVFTWTNASTALTTGQSYNVTYHCIGY